MSVAMTLRVDPKLKNQLTKLSELRHVTMNKLINQALQQFAAEETLVIQGELEASLKSLKQYRIEDPDFEVAIEDVARAELSSGEDPAQGSPDALKENEATTLVRGLLGG